MTWLFSKALMDSYGSLPCSQELAAESSEEGCSTGEPFAQLNVMPTPHKFWRNDKTMEPLKLSRFGLTLQLLTESHGEAVLMSFLEDFPARISVQQEKEQEFLEKEAVYGRNLQESFAKYSPDMSLWKTAHYSLLEESTEFSETWPKWGSMRNGECFQRNNAAQTMSVSASGLLATPTAVMNQLSPAMAKWPSCKRLQEMMPTPTAHNAKEGGYPAEHARRTPTLGARLGGKPHPIFVEWMMGWPLGWTDLKPLEMDKFQSWLQQHGASFRGENNA